MAKTDMSAVTTSIAQPTNTSDEMQSKAKPDAAGEDQNTALRTQHANNPDPAKNSRK